MNKKVKTVLIALGALDIIVEAVGTFKIVQYVKEVKEREKNYREQIKSEQSTNLRLAQDLACMRQDRDNYKKACEALKED